MNKLIDLKDLLKHEILDLYSAEEQVTESLTGMIDNVTKPELKTALTKYLEVTKTHIERLDSIKASLIGETEEENTGFFSNLFGGSNSVVSGGAEGLIKEAKRMISEDMTPEVTDAAIIGAIQKIQHYAIAGYGTVRAYALALNLTTTVTTLEATLKEEYQANNILTRLAVGQVNVDAENATDNVTAEPYNEDYDRLTNSVSIMSSSNERYE